MAVAHDPAPPIQTCQSDLLSPSRPGTTDPPSAAQPGGVQPSPRGGKTLRPVVPESSGLRHTVIPSAGMTFLLP